MKLQFFTLIAVAGAIAIACTPFNVYHYEMLAHLNTAAIVSFSGAFTWVKSAGYLLMFVAMVLEGPIITSAAAFASALGYFNIFIVLVLAIMGDLIGDFVYYAMGYFGRVAFVEKYGHTFGLTKQRMEHMERLIRNHPKKTLAAIKLAPILPAPGLMMVGATKMPFGRYAWMTLLVTLPKTVLFILLGYYFGTMYNTLARYFQNGEYFLLCALVITVIAWYAYKKLTAKISMRLETM